MESMKKKVTVSLHEELVRWAREQAINKNLSLSCFIGELLEEQMRAESPYQWAMKKFFSRKPKILTRPGEKYPTREELYDRKICGR
jgi:hypothetical protein